MKLSEAIRRGSALRPQAFGHYCDSDKNTCVLGAALHAMGFLDPDWYDGADAVVGRYRSSLEFPIHKAALDKPSTCPECSQYSMNHSGTMIHLNNDHRWSRERIADWIETIEVSK